MQSAAEDRNYKTTFNPLRGWGIVDYNPRFKSEHFVFHRGLFILNPFRVFNTKKRKEMEHRFALMELIRAD
jgi:hypothetical protein